jgi:hypothetical protein
VSLERHPALKRALANQYQAILTVGAVGLSVILWNPLPLLVLVGAQLVTMPFLLDRLRRRIEIERKFANRQERAISQEQQYRELPQPARERFLRLKHVCEQITSNYRSLSPESQIVLAEQADKIEAILVSCLRRLWLLQKHAQLQGAIDGESVSQAIAELEKALSTRTMSERERDAWTQNLEVKRQLLESLRRNETTCTTLVAELDTIESLLQLLLQKSLAASDAASFAAEIDDALAQAEADEASVREMEAVVGVEPMTTREPLADALKALPPPPPPMRIPEGAAPRRR